MVCYAMLSMVAESVACTASERSGIAPACEATHAPQRFPASFSVAKVGAAQKVVGHGRGEGIASADGVGDLHTDAGMLMPALWRDQEAALAAAGDGDHLQCRELGEKTLRTDAQSS